MEEKDEIMHLVRIILMSALRSRNASIWVTTMAFLVVLGLSGFAASYGGYNIIDEVFGNWNY